MNKSKNSDQTRENEPESAPCPAPQNVHIDFAHPTAESVTLVGTFNNWRMEALTPAGEGRWVKDIALPPGTYEYCLVLDGGRWVTDPQAPEKAYTAFGVFSVLKVFEPDQRPDHDHSQP